MGWKNRIFFDIAEAFTESDTIGGFVLDPTGTLIDPRDIRALTNADIVTVEQGTSPWVIGDGGGSITVDAVDLDIRNLVFATDKVDVSGSTVAVTQSTSPWVVSATDFDIRDLTAATDSVSSWTKDGTGTAITSTVVGADTGLDVNILNSLTVDINGVYDAGTNPAPDNVGVIAHTRSAAPGAAQQTFRSTGGVASSDNVVAANVQGLDANSFMMAYDGTDWDRVRHRNNELLVNDTANAAILHTQKTVTTSSGALLAGQLANRKYLLIQQNGSGTTYIGASGVDVATGFPIANGSVAELRCGPAVSVHAITNTGTRDIRLLELS